MAGEVGRIAWDPARDRWFLDFRRVLFPGAEQLRRVRLFTVPWVGKFDSREIAERVLERIRAEYLDKSLPQVLARYIGESAKENAIGAYWQLFLEEKEQDHRDGDITRKRLDELRAYERRGYLKPLLNHSIHSLKRGTLEDWRRWLLRTEFSHGPLSPKSVQHVVHDVGTFLRWLCRRGDIEEVPDIPEVKIREPYAPKIPSEETLEAILHAIPDTKRGLFLARGYMGLRPSEARAVPVSGYDPQKEQLVLTRTKTRKLRVLPLDPDLAEWLRQHARPKDRLQGDPPLFQNPDATSQGRSWTPASERRVWMSACRKVGVTIKPNEGGRHAFATHAAARGAAQIALQKFMGHTDPRTTGRYVDLAGSALVGVLRRRAGHQRDTTRKPRRET